MKTEEQQRKEQSKYPILRTIGLSLIMGFFYMWVIPFLVLNDFLMNLSYPRADRRYSILRNLEGIKIRWRIHHKRQEYHYKIEVSKEE